MLVQSRLIKLDNSPSLDWPFNYSLRCRPIERQLVFDQIWLPDRIPLGRLQRTVDRRIVPVSWALVPYDLALAQIVGHPGLTMAPRANYASIAVLDLELHVCSFFSMTTASTSYPP